MGWQVLAVVLAVALALAYVVWRGVRAWYGKSAGCGTCQCAPKAKATTLISEEQVTLLVRRRP
jgi:hypothetical protein